MEMKQCPQCGKYGAADRTYCMNCGVTLGVRCPDCRAVMPVGTRTCTACGHSFVKKKQFFSFPLWKWMKTNAKPLVLGAVALLFVFCFVTAAFPAVVLTVTEPEAELPILTHALTGYRLMSYFLGAHPDDIEALMGLRDLEESKSLLQVLFFGQGFGMLLAIVALAFAVILAAPNYRRFARLTARRLYAPLGIALGGAVLAGGLSLVTSSVLTGAMIRYTEDAEAGYLVTTSSVWPLVLAVVALAVFALYTLMHLTVLGKEESDYEEYTLGQILSVPLGYVTRFVRRLWRKISKKAAQKPERDEPSFTVTPRFSTYIVLLIVSLVFTQALLSKVSNIFFWFMFLLPIALCIYTLLCRHALSVSMLSDTVTTEKNTPYTYEFRIDNHSILALPFVEALVSIPQSNSVRCTERTVRLSMAPMTGYHMKNTVRFRFRGTYDIGVRCFYIYDFFRLFRARVDVENLTTIYVMPRRLTLDDTLAQAISDSTVRTVRSPLVVDKLEVSDIRDYQNGDSLKSIHWKLSSKSENFIVKDYNTGTSNQTVVFCDLTPHFPDEPPRPKTPEEIAAEANAGKSKKQLRAEKKAQKKAEKEAKAAEERAKSDRRAKQKRIKESKDTHAISDEALQERLDQRAAAAEAIDAKNGNTNAPAAGAATITVETVDVHELATPTAYEDMNEYLADGVVELTIASVLAELRQGHEVLLLWFDRRSDTGVFAYPLRGADEFENIYHLFATAPLCAPDRKVTSLAAMLSDIQSAKQMFVISTLDAGMLTDLAALPGVSDAGSFGSAEVVLYNPEERFKHPRERSAYLEGCREQLAATGLSLTAGSFNITAPQASPEGGVPHEA